MSVTGLPSGSSGCVGYPIGHTIWLGEGARELSTAVFAAVGALNLPKPSISSACRRSSNASCNAHRSNMRELTDLPGPIPTGGDCGGVPSLLNPR